MGLTLFGMHNNYYSVMTVVLNGLYIEKSRGNLILILQRKCTLIWGHVLIVTRSR